MPQETPHTSFETGSEAVADVEVGRDDVLKQIAGALGRHALMREQIVKINDFINKGIDEINRGWILDPRDIEADF